MNPRNFVLDGVSGGRIHSPLRGVTRRRCGFLSNYFGHLFSLFTLGLLILVTLTQNSVHAACWDLLIPNVISIELIDY